MVHFGVLAGSCLPGVGHDVSECPPLEKFHDNPQLVSHQVAVVHVDHVLVMVVPHDHNLKQRDRAREGRRRSKFVDIFSSISNNAMRLY